MCIRHLNEYEALGKNIEILLNSHYEKNIVHFILSPEQDLDLKAK